MKIQNQSAFIMRNLMEDIFPENVSAFPPVNIDAFENSYKIELSVPGIKKEAIDIQIEKELLVIQYDHKEINRNQTQKTIKKEFQQKSFKRTFTLDEKIDAPKIIAKYEQGILNIHLPIKEQAIAPKIQIEVK